MPGNEVESRRSRKGSGDRGAHKDGVSAHQRDLPAFSICEPTKQWYGPHPAEEEGGVEQGTEVRVLLWGERAVPRVDKAGRAVTVEDAGGSGAVDIAEAQRGPQVELA